MHRAAAQARQLLAEDFRRTTECRDRASADRCRSGAGRPACDRPAGAQRDHRERRALQRRLGLTPAHRKVDRPWLRRRPIEQDASGLRGRERTRRSGPREMPRAATPQYRRGSTAAVAQSARCTPTCVQSHSRPCRAHTETSSAASRNSTSDSLASVVTTTWVRCPRFCGVCRGRGRRRGWRSASSARSATFSAASSLVVDSITGRDTVETWPTASVSSDMYR